ncbi:MAG: hypothetical protein PHT02_06945 [Tissierellia bacterium]|nr:hypothetical protein [Tissierellia bacterium]
MEIFKLWGSVFVDNEKANKAIDETDKKGKGLSNSFEKMGGVVKGAGEKMSAFVSAPIIGGVVALTQGTKELRGDLATLSTNAGIAGQDMGILNDAMVKLYAVTGETDSNVEGLSELMATGFRDEQLSTLLDSLYGASIKFKDTMKFEGISDGLQETLATGAAIGPFGELLERSGIALDGFNEGLTEAIKNGNEEQYVLDVLAKTGLSDTYNAYRQNNEEMVKAEEANFRMQQSMAKLGATIEPILTPIINGFTNLVTKFNQLDPASQKVILIVVGIVAALGPLLLVLGSLMTVLPMLGAAFAVITLPIAGVVAGIVALIAIGVALYKNWDEISAFAGEMWGNLETGWSEGTKSLKTAWANMGTDIKSAWQGLWSDVKTEYDGAELNLQTVSNRIVTWVTTKFTTFQTGFLGIWSAITGGIKGYANNIITYVNGIIDALNTIQVDIPEWVPGFGGESFGIDISNVPYLAKGGIVTSPTLAMIGEAGPEAVIPLNKNGTGTTIGDIYIYGSNADEIWEKFERKLNRLGVKL